MSLSEPLAIVLFYLTSVVVYRLLLHPLRKFPGPKLAAVTDFYQAYFDIVKGGAFLDHLRELHSEYGPVVRVGPNTLHFVNQKAYHDIYTQGQTLTKYKQFYECFGRSDSFSFYDPKKARSRRALLNPLFSRRAILKLENVVQGRVDKLVQRLSTWPKTEPVNLSFAFRCTTLDVISEYSFAQCFNALEVADFLHPIICAVHKSLPDFWKLKHFPILVKAKYIMPEWFTLWLNPGLKPLLDNERNLGAQVDKLLADKEVLKTADHETVYHHMLNPSEKAALNNQRAPLTRQDLLDEAVTLIAAGSDTVGLICTVGAFYGLQNPDITQKIKQELKTVWPDPESSVSLTVLEKLPYLTAFLKETLRFGHGVVTPLPRVVGASNTIIDGSAVPVGTVVGMSCVFLHEDPNIFENPLEFSPERWLRADTREMDSNLAPFSKGPRICLGLNLAWCELYLIFANLFRKLDMRLADTTLEDMRTYKEYLIPYWEERMVNAMVTVASD
ncbi:benzoate 4-monooxygenase cytochrome p450 [Moniliophthora roreri MCA 2997]|uniref:Benzoate 4-monooxygenase cytochrome p450 n=1 Tax=Moniliophthora roreri (strain MCA 2997) TaxID=1381753 RepID=V2WZ59_MONRO|nr:benzoate 4-monooxygenase cytochrome p450 [Moniliophthora roreri MCA 2997]